jgi:hypothetical protein
MGVSLVGRMENTLQPAKTQRFCLVVVGFGGIGEGGDDGWADDHGYEGEADKKIVHWVTPRWGSSELIHTLSMPSVTKNQNSTITL